MPKRDFDAARREQRREPIEFTIGGQDFTCVPRLPSGSILDLIDAYAASGGEDIDLDTVDPKAITQLVQTFRQFLTDCLDDESSGRFQELLHSKSEAPDFEELQDIVMWLSEQYTGRPTQPSSPSEGSSQTAGPSSKGPSGSAPAVDSPTLTAV